MIQFHINDVLIPIFIAGTACGIVFLVLALWKKNPKYYQIGGISLLVGIAAFLGIGFTEDYPDNVEEAVAIESSSEAFMSKDALVELLEEKVIASYGTFSISTENNAIEYTPDIGSEVWLIMRKGQTGTNENAWYELMGAYEELSELIYEVGDCLFIVNNPQGNGSQMIFTNGTFVIETTP